LQTVQTALSLAAAAVQKTEMDPSRQELDAAYDFQNLVGCDPKFLRVLRIIGRISGTDASVLITGESGTGKELVAEAIHRNSPRKQGPFVKVNLGGISSTLFESEMFGHVKGAFTDAHQDRKGRFELAHGGTIFLDEIGELDLGSQVKMLRVLQDRTFEVLGSSVSRRVDVRVVSATNQNLADLVGRGEFREDLLYRLNLIAVHLPSLRERRDDILLLTHHFLKSMGQVYRRRNVSLSPPAAEWLRIQSWPGNIRQLKHLLERAMLMTSKAVLEVQDFSLPDEMEAEESHRDFLPPPGSLTLDEMEKAMIVQSLQQYSGNISKVAEALGLSRPALYRRMEKYGLIS
jgi:transcriptional regulator with PAS, ATPase and Fis domain